VAEPTDEQLFAMFNDTDGDSTYDGWLAIYKAGAAEGRRQALEDAADALDAARDPESERWDSSLGGADFDTDWLRKRAHGMPDRG